MNVFYVLLFCVIGGILMLRLFLNIGQEIWHRRCPHCKSKDTKEIWKSHYFDSVGRHCNYCGKDYEYIET